MGNINRRINNGPANERKRQEYIARKRKELKAKKMKAIAVSLIQLLLPVIIIVAVIVIAVICIKKTNLSSNTENQIEVIEIKENLSNNVAFNLFDSDDLDEENETVSINEGETTFKEHNPSKYGLFDGYDLLHTNESYLSSEEVYSEYALIINACTGEVIASRNADSVIYPASMTKVMTLMVAVEHLADEDSLNDIVTISSNDTNYAYSNDLSIVGWDIGEEVTVKDLLYGTILPSGGDAAHALAVYTAGSEEAFADMMNEKAKELGLSSSCHFTNCSGLFNEEHHCTLLDMAIIMKAAEENELCRQVLSERIYTTTPSSAHPDGIEISNWFIRRIEDKDVHGKVLGAKTGFVSESGCNAVSYQESDDGQQYICVTVNSWSSWRTIYDHVAIYDTYTK